MMMAESREGTGQRSRSHPRPLLREVQTHYANTAQAAAMLGLRQRRVRGLVAAGVLDGERLGGRWYIVRASVARLREERAAAGRAVGEMESEYDALS